MTSEKPREEVVQVPRRILVELLTRVEGLLKIVREVRT